MEKPSWPTLDHADHFATLQSLQLWMQIVGKIRVAQTPWLNHSWHVPLYVTARGLDTRLVPLGERAFTLEFDLLAHQLLLRTTNGDDERMPLAAMSVADFLGELTAMLERAQIRVDFHGAPNEIAGAVPFREDTAARPYDRDYTNALWRALVQIDRVMHAFRTGFLGKASPVHFFWGAPDLAVTRFSGRRAPQHPGGIPNLPDAITREAYSHEVSSAGFWPGTDEVPAVFYSYAYPEPAGFAQHAVEPAAAKYDDGLKEFLLPYEAVRTADDPAATLMRFLQTSYEAAAVHGGWDRAELECRIGEPGRPRAL